MTSLWASRLGWAVVLISGCVMGLWIAKTRLSERPDGVLPRAMARLVVQTTPDVPFTAEVRASAGEVPKLYDGAHPMVLEPGDYFVDVVPSSPKHQRKRLKIHLGSEQQLVLPVVLQPSPEPLFPVAVVREQPIPTPPVPEAPMIEDEELPDPGPRRMCGLDASLRNRNRRIEEVLAPVRGRLADAVPEVESKSVDREALSRYIRSRKAAVLGCYEKELKRKPSLQGKLVVRFLITKMGRASEIAVEEDTLRSDPVSSCVKAIIRGWVFPFKPEENAPVAHPFLFSSYRLD